VRSGVAVQRSLRAAARRAGVSPEIAPHDLRRVCASLLVASGVAIATAAAILGYRRASRLPDVCAPAQRGPMRAAADRLQARFSSPAPTPETPPGLDSPPG
jgi:Phage integrase family